MGMEFAGHQRLEVMVALAGAIRIVPTNLISTLSL